MYYLDQIINPDLMNVFSYESIVTVTPFGTLEIKTELDTPIAENLQIYISAS